MPQVTVTSANSSASLDGKYTMYILLFPPFYIYAHINFAPA